MGCPFAQSPLSHASLTHCHKAGLTTAAKVELLKAVHCLLGEIDNIHCYCNTGNAHGGQASGAEDAGQRSLTGHCFTGLDYYLKTSDNNPRICTTLLEGTKWVKPMFATTVDKMQGSKICRNACLDCPTLQTVNQLSSLLMELTKIPEVTPTLDIGCAELQIMQGTFHPHYPCQASADQSIQTDKGDNFYANVYVSDDKIIFHESIPGVPNSPKALGAPITFITHRVSSLKPITMRYQLASEHMRIAGYKDIGECEIQGMVMGVAMEEAVPAWRKQVCIAFLSVCKH